MVQSAPRGKRQQAPPPKKSPETLAQQVHMAFHRVSPSIFLYSLPASYLASPSFVHCLLYFPRPASTAAQTQLDVVYKHAAGYMDKDGNSHSDWFRELPNRASHPRFYQLVANPICLKDIKVENLQAPASPLLAFFLLATRRRHIFLFFFSSNRLVFCLRLPHPSSTCFSPSQGQAGQEGVPLLGRHSARL
jgi:hypothetical protein